MVQATGVFKQVAIKREVTFGLIPVAAAAQLLRRVTSTVDLSKDTYSSNEIRPDMQVADFRHGVRRVKGSISGELSPKTYSDQLSAMLKRDFTAGASTAAASITIAGAVGAWTITRGTRAPQAAGKIHSDMERGFIAAEVVHYQDMIACGSFPSAREKGLLHTEGKLYTMEDGDLILVRFVV